MTYAGIQMFMEKLNQLLNCNDNPFINSRTFIRERHQFQLLYQDLASIIQTLSIHPHHDLEKVKDLKKRFTDGAEEAEYIVDLFLSGVHIRRNTRHFPGYRDFKRSLKSLLYLFLSCLHINGRFPTSWDLNLDDVRRSLKSVEVEFMSVNIDSKKMDLSPTPQRTLNQSVAAQSSISRGSKKLTDEIFVGIDGDAELIRDKLVEDQKKVDVVSIVGMGGIGKTTLATKVFNDGYVKHHFHVRVWVTVSQTYDKRGVLTQILEAIRAQLDLEKATDSRLRELLHKNLMGKRYLIIIDDIWQTETWDSIKVFFPHDNNGSRILLTSRLTEVAKHANSDGLIHHLGYMNKEKGWELLCQKVFQGNEYPEWSIKHGMQIVENCHGLPLALVVIAGVLAKGTWNEEFWAGIAEKTGSYIAGDQNGCLETLALSYNHLPLHLRECFLYLGGFPEDYEYQVQGFIWLWVAEGFIQKDGNRSLENIAESYLMDLIDRNLVMVANRSKSNGAVKAYKVHDLVRELCLRKAKEERLILITELSTQFSDVITRPYKPVRMFINNDIYNSELALPTAQNIRSILWFSAGFRFLIDVITVGLCSFKLLRVLDLQRCELDDLPDGMELLLHLRYLAIWISSKAGFPSSVCNIWSLQTLIYITEQRDKRQKIHLPSNISDLVNLRHLWGYGLFDVRHKSDFVLPSIDKPMNLETISGVKLEDGVDNFQKCFPYIKKLACDTYLNEKIDFKSLTYLEKLKVTGFASNHITFPAALKSLSLETCFLSWSEMSIIQSLPNLQVLKLKGDAIKGSCWNTDGQEFPQLQFLRLDLLDIELWEAYSTSFPCLRRLEIIDCDDLEEIPLEIGEIPTLELIQVKGCFDCTCESVRRIQEEQRDLGNYDLKIQFF